MRINLNDAFLESLEEICKFSEEFYSESERAAVIVGASKIDEILERLISKVLLPMAEKEDELFGNEKPLGTFSSKINIAYRLGLIDLEMRRALHIYRKIRNDFSHNIFGCRLNQEPHINRLFELAAPLSKDPIYKGLIERFPSKYVSSEEGKMLKVVISLLIGRLVALEHSVQPIHKINESYVLNSQFKSN